MAPCARCCCIGARCVTSAPGRPGRPRQQRLAGGDSTVRNPRATAASPIDVSSPGRHRTDTVHVEIHAPVVAVAPAPARALRCRADRRTSKDRLNGVEGPDLTVPKSAVYSQPPKDALAHDSQPDIWVAPGDISTFFASPSIDQSPALDEDTLPLADRLSSPSQLQGLLSADDELNAMLHLGGNSGTALDVDVDPLLDHWESDLPPTFPPQGFSAANSLVRFREEIDQRIMTVDAYYSDPSVQNLPCCRDGGAGWEDDENPVALLLTCSEELVAIIQSLSPAAPLHTHTEDALSTEILLLALSGYLALMRLIDSLFHRIYTYLCQVPRKSYASIKVKSVLRVGGVSALQDMPLKAYAAGIVDVIKSQVQIVELCMGIPPEYCLAREAVAVGVANAATEGRFYTRPD